MSLGATATAPDEWVETYNRTLAVIKVAGQARILEETEDGDGRPTCDFLKERDFLLLRRSDRTIDPETGRPASAAEVWLKHPNRREFRGIVFAPEGASPDFYNLWRGFAVEAAPACRDLRDHVKHFPTFYDHVLKNVASGDESLARWVWGWFAHMIQKPTERIGTALVLRGKQGAGKTKPGEIIGSLLGPHWVLIDDPKHLVGRFNGHMADCLLLQAEEAFWAGDKAAEGRLKSLITSNVHLVERKGVDAIPVRNLVRLLVTSNNDWVVPAGMEERRFAVLDVGDGNLKDRAYFGQIDQEMAGSGRSHLLAYLQRFDLTNVDVGKIPATRALFETKLESLSDLNAWWFDRLRAGTLLPHDQEWAETIVGEQLHSGYVAALEKMGRHRKQSQALFGVALAKVMPKDGFIAQAKVYAPEYGPNGEVIHTADGRPAQKRRSGYVIPPLVDCRAAFEQMIGWPIDWTAENGPAATLSAGESGRAPERDFDLDDE